MINIGNRLRAERERMGLSQTDFAKLADHSRSVQAGYEQGRVMPGGAYLAAIAAAGVDVLYVLTGQRTPSPDGVVVESEEEKRLLENYRAMDQAAKLNIQAVGDSFAQSSSEIKKDAG